MDNSNNTDFKLGEFPWKKPQLSKPADNDLSKRWFVDYGVWSYDANRIVRKRMNVSGKTVADRLARAKLLLFDQNEVVDKALTTLRLQIYHQPIGANLLPEKFTLPEIHALYETFLGKKLVSLGLIKKLDERRAIGAHRSPYLYQFEKEVYEQALIQGIVHTY